MTAPSCPHGLDAAVCSQCSAVLETHISGPRLLPPELAATRTPGTPGPSSDGAVTDAPLERGTAVGRYLILEVLGQGGMGRVYSAYDPELERKVAIKLLRASAGGSTDTSGHVRLLREAQAMARLNHPNVVAVHDVGTFGTSVFVAMELVEGQTLAEWLSERRPWREVVAVFIAAGRGLCAAHAAGIIHRDFKPANVLLGQDGRVRVTDFGLARAEKGDVTPASAGTAAPLERTSGSLSRELTLAGSVMGTPGYMAPEQLAGEPATALTDQFNFAASLYEGLFGQPPFRGASFAELIRAVTQGAEPPPQGTDVPTWLQRVVMRALSSAPADRHPSLEQLLAELGEDHDAQRRRWRVRGAAVGVAILGAVGFVLLDGGAARSCETTARQRLATVWTAEVRARAQAAFDASPQPFARVTFEQAAAALERYREGWLEAHRSACEATRVREEQTEVDLALRYECLEATRRNLDAVGQLLAAADEATITHAVRAANGLPPLERCADLRSLRLPVPPPARAEDRDRLTRAQATLAEAEALVQAGKGGKARSLLPPLLTLGDDPGFRPFYAEVLALQAELTRGEAGVAKALEAVAMAERAHADLIRARSVLGLARNVGYHLKRPAEGDALLALASAAVDRAGGDPVLRAREHQIRGDIAWTRGRYPDALAAYRSALELRQETFGARHPEVASSLYDLGWVLMEQRDAEQARALLQDAYAMRLELLGEGHPEVLASLNSLAALHSNLDEFDEAIVLFEKLRASAVRIGSEDMRATAMTNLALAHFEAGNAAQALALATESRAIFTRLYGAESPNALMAVANESQTLAALGRLDEAIARAEEARALAGKMGNARLDCSLLLHLGTMHSEKGRHPQALAMLEGALGSCEKVEGPDSVHVAHARHALGKARLAAGDPRRAQELMEAALTKLEPVGRPVELAKLRFDLARALARNRKDPARALQLAQAAHAAFVQKKQVSDTQQVEAWLSRRP